MKKSMLIVLLFCFSVSSIQSTPRFLKKIKARFLRNSQASASSSAPDSATVENQTSGSPSQSSSSRSSASEDEAVEEEGYQASESTSQSSSSRDSASEDEAEEEEYRSSTSASDEELVTALNSILNSIDSDGEEDRIDVYVAIQEESADASEPDPASPSSSLTNSSDGDHVPLTPTNTPATSKSSDLSTSTSKLRKSGDTSVEKSDDSSETITATPRPIMVFLKKYGTPAVVVALAVLAYVGYYTHTNNRSLEAEPNTQ